MSDSPQAAADPLPISTQSASLTPLLPPTIVILAGKRDGQLDPLAAAAGVSHKCRVPICGRALLSWVLEAAEGAWPGAPIWISIHDPEVIADLPEVIRLQAAGRLHIALAQPGILDSVAAVVEASGQAFPMLITTGDNVLASPESLRALHDSAVAQQCDAALGVANREAILAAHPDAQRFFYQFSDRAIANCNSYWLGSPKAMRAAEAFREGGQFMKSKVRIAKAFGLHNLLAYQLGWLSFDGALRRMSGRFGVRIGAHSYADGAYAVDVDNQRTYDVCALLLRARKGEAIPPEAQSST
jgi:GTP:adenosylcobinamide-phosphate guanylyltransferase